MTDPETATQLYDEIRYLRERVAALEKEIAELKLKLAQLEGHA